MEKKLHAWKFQILKKTRFAEFSKYQPYRVINYLLSVKNNEIDKQKSVCYIKIFWLA